MFHAALDICCLQLYSIIRDSPGLSGPAGIELSIELQATNVQGRLHDPEGTSSPLETKLAGTLKDGELHLVGQNRPGRVEIQGKMYVASFRGTIRRRIDRQEFSERVVLKRKIFVDEDRVASLSRQAQSEPKNS